MQLVYWPQGEKYSLEPSGPDLENPDLPVSGGNFHGWKEVSSHSGISWLSSGWRDTARLSSCDVFPWFYIKEAISQPSSAQVQPLVYLKSIISFLCFVSISSLFLDFIWAYTVNQRSIFPPILFHHCFVTFPVSYFQSFLFLLLLFFFFFSFRVSFRTHYFVLLLCLLGVWPVPHPFNSCSHLVYFYVKYIILTLYFTLGETSYSPCTFSFKKLAIFTKYWYFIFLPYELEE